ncbi:MAG: septum formation initiator family protein [Caldimicrobium sp.]
MPRSREIIIRPYSKKRRKKRLRRFFLFFLSVLVVFTLSLYFFLNWLIKKENEEVEKLKTKNQSLRSEIKKYESSDEAYEELLRVKMGYIKDGEKIIIYK